MMQKIPERIAAPVATGEPPVATVDPAQTRLVQELKHTAPLVGCRLDPGGQFVFAGCQDNTIQRWHLATGKKTALAGHRSWVRALAFAGCERLLFSGGWEGKILTWPLDADNPTPVRTLDAHQGWVRALAVDPEGKWLASCGNDALVRLWSIPDGKLLRTFEGHTCHVYNVAFHPKAPFLASGDLKGNVKVWDLNKGKEERTLDVHLLHKYDTTFRADHGGVRSMAFNAEGSLLACAGITDVSNAFAGVGKPVVVLLDWASGKQKLLLRPRENFQGTAWGTAFHPAGYVIGVGGGNGGVLWYWKPDNAADVFALKLPTNARDLDLHPDGKRLAVAFFDGAVRIYDLSKKA
jgi:WD40 repeat protein